MRCRCESSGALVEIGQHYSQFVAGLTCLDTGDWVKLMQCQECAQLWRVDEWDQYQGLYALKLDSADGWKEVDMAGPIKERMMQNHGGLDSAICLAGDCPFRALKGRAYCVDHFYATGARV